MLPIRSRRAEAFIFSLILVIIVGVIVYSLLNMVTYQARAMRRFEIRQQEFSAAELGINKVYAEIRHFLEFGTGDVSAAIASIQPPAVAGINYERFVVNQLGASMEMASSGPFVGHPLYTLSYQVEVAARTQGQGEDYVQHPGVGIRQDIRVRFVPLYIFGIFYDADLEILPGPTFVESGRVHCNGDIYVGSGQSLSFRSYVTAHGDIIHGYHPYDTNHTTPQNGSVNYWDGTVSLTDLVDGVWLDSRQPNWAEAALERWNGYVLDSAHAMPELPLPIPQTETPHVLIEPPEEDDPLSVSGIKFCNLADLYITVEPGTYAVSAQDIDGNPVDLTYDHDGNPATPPEPIYTLSTFRDNREGVDVTTIDIDIQKMIAAGLDPPNGILYVEAETGVRLVNGATLPTNSTGGFTVATNGPLYVQGDYNTVNTKLSLLACDAINILSNAWLDANSTNWSRRNAANTSVKSVIMAGNVPTDQDTPYSGGVENYFRFHENWTGRTFSFRGSIINLWVSQVATANWRYGNPVYTAPNRNWDWDVIYGGVAGPPGMPRVYFIDRLEWQEVSPIG